MLKVNSTLMELDLSRCGIRDFGLQLLAEELHSAREESKLAVLKLKANQITLVDDSCVIALKLLLTSPSCRLNSLLLGSNPLKDEGALKFADIFKENQSLVDLDLCSCGMTSRGLCAIGHAISPDAHRVKHPKVMTVSLWGNKFDSAACVVWQQIISMIDVDISVQEIDGAFNCVRK